MQLLAILVAVGALLEASPTPAAAQPGRSRSPRPSRSRRRGSTPTPATVPPQPPGSDSADFVVVGGGTAGCVLAARICENLPDSSVALLERGAPRTERQELLVQAPRLYATALNDPMLTEAWDTQPNAGLGGRRLRSLTGSTLGGSSAVNGLQWTKPPLATFRHGHLGIQWCAPAVTAAPARRAGMIISRSITCTWSTKRRCDAPELTCMFVWGTRNYSLRVSTAIVLV